MVNPTLTKGGQIMHTNYYCPLPPSNFFTFQYEYAKAKTLSWLIFFLFWGAETLLKGLVEVHIKNS
jgi:hypothetical protein